MQEETLKLLGKRTIVQNDENGTTGYTIFTATSLCDSFCVDASKSYDFDLSCEGNKIGIWCDDGENLITPARWNGQLKPYLLEHASFVKLNDSDFSGLDTHAYACKVIFPMDLGARRSGIAEDDVIRFNVSFTAMTEDKQSTIQLSQNYNVMQCPQE